MNAGAFSDDKVLAAAQRIVPILVDCTVKGAHADLMEKYGVRGYPSAVYVDPEGRKIKDLRDRVPDAVAKEIGSIAAKYPGRPTMWQNSIKAAIEAGKKAKKPVAIYFAAADTDLIKLTLRFTKDVGDRKTKFLWALEVAGDTTAETWSVEAPPTILVIDPKAGNPAEKPLGKIAIGAETKSFDVNRQLDEAAKAFKK